MIKRLETDRVAYERAEKELKQQCASDAECVGK